MDGIAVAAADTVGASAAEPVRAYYDELRAHEVGHNAALRQVGNRLVGILHGCLKTHSPYNETTAWSHRSQPAATGRRVCQRLIR